MTQTGRALIGFFLAPLLPCAIIVGLALITGGAGAEFLIILILSVSYAVSLLIGGPAYWLLNKYRRTGVLSYALAAVAASIVPIFCVFFYGHLITSGFSQLFEGILPVHYGIMAFMVAIGVIISVTFWFIVRPDRADRLPTDAPQA